MMRVHDNPGLVPVPCSVLLLWLVRVKAIYLFIYLFVRSFIYLFKIESSLFALVWLSIIKPYMSVIIKV